MLIGQEGEKHGLITFKDALEQGSTVRIRSSSSFTIWFRSNRVQAYGLW
jgi:hypothetical protein